MIETAPQQSTSPEPEKPMGYPLMAFTRSYTLELKHAEVGGIATKAKNILDSAPSSLLTYRIKGRGPCPGCEGGTENHHGGSKCKKKATLQTRIRFQPVVNLVTNIFRKTRLFTSGLR